MQENELLQEQGIIAADENQSCLRCAGSWGFAPADSCLQTAVSNLD